MAEGCVYELQLNKIGQISGSLASCVVLQYCISPLLHSSLERAGHGCGDCNEGSDGEKGGEADGHV